METAAGRRRGMRKPVAAGAEVKIERLQEYRADTGGRLQVSPPRRPGWNQYPRSIYGVVCSDESDTGPTSPVAVRGNALEGGESAMRKLRGYDLDTARREAPGPWRIGGRDDSGVQVLDANGQRVATIWTTPSRSDATLKAIQALVVRMGDEVLATGLCANPDCRRPLEAPSRTQKHCSATCGVATQPHMSSRPANATNTRMHCVGRD